MIGILLGIYVISVIISYIYMNKFNNKLNSNLEEEGYTKLLVQKKTVLICAMIPIYNVINIVKINKMKYIDYEVLRNNLLTNKLISRKKSIPENEKNIYEKVADATEILNDKNTSKDEKRNAVNVLVQNIKYISSDSLSNIMGSYNYQERKKILFKLKEGLANFSYKEVKTK